MMETNSDDSDDCRQRSARTPGASVTRKRSPASERIDHSEASVPSPEALARTKRPRVDGTPLSQKGSDDDVDYGSSSLAGMASQEAQQHDAPERPNDVHSMLNRLQHGHAVISNAAISDAASRAFLGLPRLHQTHQQNTISGLLSSSTTTQSWGSVPPASPPSAPDMRSLFGVPFGSYQLQPEISAQQFLHLRQSLLGASQHLLTNPIFLRQWQGLQHVQPAAHSDLLTRFQHVYDQRSPFFAGSVAASSTLNQQQMAQLSVLGQQSVDAQSYNLGMASLSGLLEQLNPRLGHSSHLTAYGNALLAPSLTNTNAVSLPTVIARPEDSSKLSTHQVLLRRQIEVFQASENDVQTHIRGRNKPITLGQVGIRCRHCAHLPVSRRQKGSTYFPASVVGLYQAAQNMNTTHMQCGLCTEMPEEIKRQFAELITTKTPSSGAGRPYWAQSARKMGLVDAGDAGIRFVREIPLLNGAGGLVTT